ncbi:Glutamine--fructose-6-phosphate aminotransferase [Candidatus Trichorickettsia mobilis]|uniref:Glutamine--fructose-6-phosphate aminotransferase [isomerizing] n=1 Tax=Candidatus Trichorickettsia mobilis TaxID=1346319 RepID=A0ABZ0URY7_9RICK|nr:glutamine--fructose-6-phosphate transaminase (isomerizing) [Candidatus Trichorickettsia mobilis]WPY00795.1 Glutamine--fructose-6-phosphate aminotransferase [Candidatus Trichorickettsia mobilis]
MCGIIAGISINNILPTLVSGLEKLEYRGYDSAGIAVLINNRPLIHTVKTVGKVNALKKLLSFKEELNSYIGIGHTRWATHGAPSVENAHPHGTERVAIVHNGIIENYSQLKQELQQLGYKFKSDTDTEVVANLLDYYLTLDVDAEAAAHQTISKLEGSFAVVFMFRDSQFLFAASKKNSLILGLADHGTYIASDVIAFGNMVSDVIYLEDGDKVIVKLDSYYIFDQDQNIAKRTTNKSLLLDEISKKDYPHFMLKEIHEQPIVLARTIDRYLKGKGLFALDIDWPHVDRIKILACGTAYYSGLVAKYWLEELTDINVDLEIASEYRYRAVASSKNGVTIVISQSGETLDTLEALRKAKADGQTIIAITNVEKSSIARISDYVLPIMVGAEIGVASTKAFLGQLMVLAGLSIDIGVKTGNLTSHKSETLTTLLLSVPTMIEEILLHCNNIKNIAMQIKDFKSALFIARGSLYPIALEGSLKMKELSYIHAEGYAGGELKHGAMALIDNNMPVIALIPHHAFLFDKMFSNLQEVIARGARVLSIISKDDADKVGDYSTWILPIPNCDQFIAPMIYTIPLQLLAYYTADLKGNDIDQPRNLAKSVTVE